MLRNGRVAGCLHCVMVELGSYLFASSLGPPFVGHTQGYESDQNDVIFLRNDIVMVELS